MFIFQFRFLASASAAAITCLARSSPIDRPYGISNGIASGVPPADGGDAGVAGAGACASVGELINAMAQAASVIETIERIVSSRLKFIFVVKAVDSAATFTSRSECRTRAVSAIGNARGLHGPVRLLFRGGDENLGPRLKLIPVTRDIGDNNSLGGHEQFLLAILVLDGKHLSVNPGDGLLDIGIGHLALRLEIPVVVAFAGAAHRFREDMHLDGLLGTVGLHHSG